MTISLCILGWLLSGFLAAWVMQRYLDEGKYDYAVGPILVMSALGGIVLFIVSAMLLSKGMSTSNEYFKKALTKPVFKAKEPK